MYAGLRRDMIADFEYLYHGLRSSALAIAVAEFVICRTS